MDYKKKQVVYSFWLINYYTKKKQIIKMQEAIAHLPLVINGLFPAVVGVNMTL